jgi:hypothetical protein
LKVVLAGLVNAVAGIVFVCFAHIAWGSRLCSPSGPLSGDHRRPGRPAPAPRPPAGSLCRCRPRGNRPPGGLIVRSAQTIDGRGPCLTIPVSRSTVTTRSGGTRGPSGGGWSQGHSAGSANPRTMSSMPAGVERTNILAVSDSTRKGCSIAREHGFPQCETPVGLLGVQLDAGQRSEEPQRLLVAGLRRRRGNRSAHEAAASSKSRGRS